jgi:hypothetical protein
MKRNLVGVVFCISLLACSASRAQAPGSDQDKNLLALLKEVQAQQAQIVDNQGKIETKLSEIAESVRVARIFAGRAE